MDIKLPANNKGGFGIKEQQVPPVLAVIVSFKYYADADLLHLDSN